jgi:microcystin-dependent protein
LSRFTSTRVINSRWRNNDFVGAAGSTHTFPDAFHEEFLVDWALQIADGSVVITETPTTGNIQVSTLTVGDIVLTGTATGFPGAPAITGTAPINVVTASGTSTVSLNANYSTSSHLHDGTYQPFGTYITAINGTAPIEASTNSAGVSTVSITASYSTSTHLHDADYVNVGGDTMSGQLLVSSATTTSTVGFGEIIVAKGTSYGSITVNATDDHLHLRSKNAIEVLEQSGPTMQGLRARGLGVNSSHTYPTLVDNGITFGEDANLYRVSANALKTDDALEVVGSLTNGGTSVSLSTHTHAYQPAGTYVTAVNGTAPITASTSTAGIVTVALTANLSPTGSIVMWATSAAPSGWLFLDGSTYSQATYPNLAAVFGVVSGTFTLPDMRDRFVGGLAVVGALTNNAGTFAPNTANIHTHTTDIAHAHADTIAVSTHGDHTHTTNPAATASGTPSAVTISIATTGGATAGSGTHTHSTDIAATASGAENTNLTHTVTGGVTSLGATSVTSSNGSLTPKSTLLNFIIKA